jgi:hypothetical protein
VRPQHPDTLQHRALAVLVWNRTDEQRANKVVRYGFISKHRRRKFISSHEVFMAEYQNDMASYTIEPVLPSLDESFKNWFVEEAQYWIPGELEERRKCIDMFVLGLHHRVGGNSAVNRLNDEWRLAYDICFNRYYRTSYQLRMIVKRHADVEYGFSEKKLIAPVTMQSKDVIDHYDRLHWQFSDNCMFSHRYRVAEGTNVDVRNDDVHELYLLCYTSFDGDWMKHFLVGRYQTREEAQSAANADRMLWSKLTLWLKSIETLATHIYEVEGCVNIRHHQAAYYEKDNFQFHYMLVHRGCIKLLWKIETPKLGIDNPQTLRRWLRLCNRIPEYTPLHGCIYYMIGKNEFSAVDLDGLVAEIYARFSDPAAGVYFEKLFSSKEERERLIKPDSIRHVVSILVQYHFIHNGDDFHDAGRYRIYYDDFHLPTTDDLIEASRGTPTNPV